MAIQIYNVKAFYEQIDREVAEQRKLLDQPMVGIVTHIEHSWGLGQVTSDRGWKFWFSTDSSEFMQLRLGDKVGFSYAGFVNGAPKALQVKKV